MFCILLFHLLGHGLDVTNKGIVAFLSESTIDAKFVIYSLLIFPVDCFLLISGFYGIHLKFRRLLILWLNAFIISLCIFTVSSLSENVLSINTFVKSLFPISFSTWWFLTYYFILCILSPLLNKFEEIEIKNKDIIIILLLIIDFIFKEPLLNFIVCYVLGLLLRDIKISRKQRIYIILICIAYFIGILILGLIKKPLCFLFMSNYSPFIIVQAILIFDLFRNFSYENKIITFLGNSAFLVYLITDHPYIRVKLKTFISPIISNEFMVIKFLGYSVLIFIASLCIGMVVNIFTSFIVNTIVERKKAK